MFTVMTVLSVQIQQRIYRAYFDEGLTLKELYVRYCPHSTTKRGNLISPRTIRRLVHRFNTDHHWITETPAQMAKRKSKIRRRTSEKRFTFGQQALAALRDIIDENAELYLGEIRRRLRKLGYNRTITHICRAIHRPEEHGGLGYSHLVMEQMAQQQNYEERVRFKQLLATGLFPVEQMIFIDETHKSRNEAMRRRGWGAKGERLVHTRTFFDPISVSMVGACNQHGFVPDACFVTEHGVDSDIFVLWVESHVSHMWVVG